MQGDPELVIHLLNKVFRELIGEKNLMFDSMELEYSHKRDNANELTSSSSAKYDLKKKKTLAELTVRAYLKCV
jgi:hypothetical protein